MGFLPDPLHPALVHFPIALSMVAVRLVVTAVQVSAHRSPSAAMAEAGAA